MRRSLLPLALLVVAAPSFAQHPAHVLPGLSHPSTTDAGLTDADRSRRERVYAQVGDRAIRVGDIEDALAAQTPFQQERYRGDPAKLREFADRLVQLELLGTEARRQNLGDAPRVRELVESNLVQLLMRRAIDERITPQSIPDADVRAHYDAHLEDFARPELVRASHVLLATRAEADAALEQCRTADIAQFRQTARDRSLDDESSQTGGDLRYFTRDGRTQGNVGRPIDAAIAAATFAIVEVGDCAAAPVSVGERWSVIKLTGRRAAEATPFETAQEGIRRRLWRERRDRELDAMVTEIRTRVRVTQRNDLVRLVEVAPPNPAELGHRHGDAPEPLPGDRQHGNPLQRPTGSARPAPAMR